MRLHWLGGSGMLLVLLGMGACGPADQRASYSSAPAAGAAPAPSLEQLGSATYVGIREAGGPVTLSAGRWEGHPFVAGGAARPSVTLARGFRLTGHLLGDRSEQAVVLLGASAGGSGDMVYLAVVGHVEGGLGSIATAPVGDRVQVRGGRIEGRRILLDVVEPGPHDALCCPGDLATRIWEVRDRTLTEGKAVPGGRLSPQAIAGAEWVLTHWAWDDSAPGMPEVSLSYQGGRFAGQSGCNGYVAPVRAGETPGAISVAPAAGTRMMCPRPEMEVEARFLRQLSRVKKFQFVAGQLALAYDVGGSNGVMLFERRKRP